MTFLHSALARAYHLFQKEPVACVAVFHALVTLATVFGLHPSVEQAGALEAVLTAGEGLLVRSQVSPAA